MTRETKAEKRLRLAEAVCREYRYQMVLVERRDERLLLDHLLRWMSVAPESKYERPDLPARKRKPAPQRTEGRAKP